MLYGTKPQNAAAKLMLIYQTAKHLYTFILFLGIYNYLNLISQLIPKATTSFLIILFVLPNKYY